MASNSIGNIFKVTTWGESHGRAIGAIIDGCPAGLAISEQEIDAELLQRAPGKSPYTSPRKEEDNVEIFSGVFEGVTTGTPISLLIWNRDADPSKYSQDKTLIKPGHAHDTYLKKYGIFDYRGGGRASARETASRVAAAAIAKKLLKHWGIEILAYVHQIGEVCIPNEMDFTEFNFGSLKHSILQSAIKCPHQETEALMLETLNQVKNEGNSIGGIVMFTIQTPLESLGDPMYEKLEANLAHAMMTIPASKGVEIGSGFMAARMRGDQHNDRYVSSNGKIRTLSNHSGGVVGGISNGMAIYGKVVFKPASSIAIPQETLDLEHRPHIYQLPEGSRHDPCVAIRAVPVVEAMAALVLVDSILMNRSVLL